MAVVALGAACNETPDPARARADAGAPAVSIAGARDAQVTLRRSECFGACPDYQVSIHADGRVVYIGNDFVRVRGQVTAKVEPEQARALFERFDRAGFWSFKDEYRIGITDNPTAELTLYANGRTKKVVDYPPCHYEDAAPEIRPPKELCELERAVDALANSRQWVRCVSDAGTEAACPSRFDPSEGEKPPSDAGCDPPWVVDSSGVKRVKPQCI